jgi:hypothetical protein
MGDGFLIIRISPVFVAWGGGDRHGTFLLSFGQ